MNVLLEQLAKTCRMTRLSESIPAWQASLARPTGEAIEGRKAFLAGLLRSRHELCLSYSEDPQEDGVPGQWIPLGKHVWRVPQEISNHVDLLYRWLCYGDWVLYKPSGEARLWRFVWNSLAETVIESLVRADIRFCIYSFHDNDPWFIFLNPTHFEITGMPRACGE